MILLDSNIVIYLRDPTLGVKIANQLHDSRLHTCNVVIAEVLGYKGINDADRKYFEDLFFSMKNNVLDDTVTAEVIKLRRAVSIALPDAIIAATALTNDLTLWTHNTEDFGRVPKLRILDPVAA